MPKKIRGKKIKFIQKNKITNYFKKNKRIQNGKYTKK